MRPEQWNTFKQAAKRTAKPGQVPLALIVDSPWIPGHLGISHLDYYFDDNVWFEANLAIMREFHDIIFLPSWWAELGMAAEPSVYGTRIRFFPNQTPGEQHLPSRLEDIAEMPAVDPHLDGFMPIALRRYEKMRRKINEVGYIIPMVAARGPLCTAAFYRGTTQLMMDVAMEPEATHRLLDSITDMTIDWLRAQAEAAGPNVEGILLLDDIVGMLGGVYYEEFAHPRLKRICDAFPKDWVKVYHNDCSVDAFLEPLCEVGFDVLNWGKQHDVSDAYDRTKGRMTLMGNVNPLEIGVRGTPDEVYQAAMGILEETNGDLILSFGGGVSPGAPADNIRALAKAAREFGN